MTWLLFVSLLLVALVCAFRGVSLKTFSLAMAVTLVAVAVFAPVSAIAVVLTALALTAVLLPVNVLDWRQRWISKPFLSAYRNKLPSLSDTEAVALEAGTVGWEGQLFSGNPDWDELLKTPYLNLSDEEQAFIDGPVDELCAMLNDWEISHQDADLPEEVWDFLKKERFFGMIIPREYGGLGFSAIAHRAVLQKISTVSSVAGTTVAVPNSLGPGELILHYGTDQQKQYYLPRLASGEEIPCFGLTSPSAGSDATSISDYGVVCTLRDGDNETLGIRLNFDKRYITLAPVATVVGLAFRLYDPEGLLGDTEDLGISLALLPRETEGLDIGRRHFALNIPFHNGPVRGKDVFIPLDALIGGKDMAGQGWKMLIEALSVGRGITLPSSSSGGAKACAMVTGSYARIRKQFNLPIGRFEGIVEALARIGGKTYSVSALSRMTATAVDLGERPSVPSAIAKCHATEMAREIITDAMDVHGGKGVILGPRNYLGRAWQGAPIWITVEGANILTRSMMIFGQGAIRCHPYVLKEMQAARLEDPRARLKQFDQLLFSHIGFSISNAVRSLVLGLTFGRLAKVPVRRDQRLASYYRKLSRYSASLSICADLAMLTLGGKLKQKERLSARLGDVLSQLYIASAALYRFEAQGRPMADQPLLAWSIHNSVYQMQNALNGFIDNFPNRGLAALMRLIVFPLGRWEREPGGDRLSQRVAQLMLSPSEARSRLCNGVYLDEKGQHALSFMERALPRVIAADPLERKVQKAIKAGTLKAPTWEQNLEQAVIQKVITEDEAAVLREVRALVQEIIAVDDFDSSELRLGRKAEEPLQEPAQSNAA